MNFGQMENNKVFLAGEIISEPQFSHEMFGEGFYEFDLKVRRLSDSYDVLPVTISERLISGQIQVGKYIGVYGQFRSYNKLEDNKSRLMLTMFIREIVDYDENANPNHIEITGFVCKEPVYRTTPFKREICDLLIAVNRNYNKSDYLPCIAWGRNARFVKNFEVGDKLTVFGRIQSREYQKKVDDEHIITKTAYEVSLSKITREDAFNNEKITTSIGEIDNYYVKNAN